MEDVNQWLRKAFFYSLFIEGIMHRRTGQLAGS